MNVLHIREQLSRGGIEILLFDICKNSKKKGLNLTLVTFGDGEFDKEFETIGVSLIKLSRRYPVDLSLIKSLRNIIVKENISVVHSHQAVEGLHSYLATRGLNVKNIISHHGSTYPLKDKLTMKFLVSRIDANIAVSQSYLKRLSEEEGFNTKRKFHVLYNGIDESKLNVITSDIKKELKIPKISFLLGMVGNFYGTGRDQFTVCKALPPILKMYSNIHFIFIGGWSEQNSESFHLCYEFIKKEKILDRVHFVGARKDIGNILKQLDIFVYSSNHDTFGIAVIEAILSGIPTIVNDIAPMLEITDNGSIAEIFESKNPKSLIQSIKKLVDHEEIREKLSKNGTTWANEKFTIEKYMNDLKSIYNYVTSLPR